MNKGARTNIRDHVGKTAIEYAQTTEMIRILKTYKSVNRNNIKHSESNYTSTTCHLSQDVGDTDDLVRIETQLSKCLNTLHEEDSKFEATADIKKILEDKSICNNFDMNYSNYQVSPHFFDCYSAHYYDNSATFVSTKNDIVLRKHKLDESNLCRELLSQMEHYNNHLSVSWDTFNDHSQLVDNAISQTKNLRVSQGVDELLDDKVCQPIHNQITFRNTQLDNKPHKDLEEWLTKLKLESLCNSLAQNDIFTLRALFEQLKNLNYNDKHLLLKSKGVDKCGNRDRIILGVAEDLGEFHSFLEGELKNKRFKKPLELQCCNKPPRMWPDFINPPTLQNWLRDQGLEGVYNKFVITGYDDYEWLLIQMASAYPLSNKTLSKEIGILQSAIQHRLLFRLRDGKFR
jgi:hypothetical protein